MDDDLFEELNKHTWCLNNGGYAWRAAKKNEEHPRRHVLMHRHIMGLTDEPSLVDHINGDKTDNRRENLRLATKSTNGMNRGLQMNNQSGYVGVWYDKSRHKFQAYIDVGRKRTHLGRYGTAVEAAIAYNEKAVELHGEFARLNVID